MIDVISNWAGELIVSLIIVTIIEMLLPDNKTKKYVKTVIGVYIVFCIISPFIDKKEFITIFEETEKKLEKIQIENQVASAQTTDSSIESLYIKEFEKEVKGKVKALGYEVNECKVEIEIDATKDNAGINSIYLNIGDKKTNNENEQNIRIENVQKVEISINNQETGDNNNEENEDIKKVKEFLSDYYEISEDKIKITQD